MKQLWKTSTTALLLSFLLVSCGENSESNERNDGDSEDYSASEGNSPEKSKDSGDEGSATLLTQEDIDFYGAQGFELALMNEKIVLVEYTGAETEVVIPDIVTAVGEEAFYRSNEITSIIIPDSVTEIQSSLSAVTNHYSGAFGGCNHLTNIEIPDSLEKMGGIYDFHLFSPWVSSHTEEFVILGDGFLYQYNGEGGDVVIPQGVKRIGTVAFNNNDITSLTIPDSVTAIQDYAFCMNDLNKLKDWTDMPIPDSVVEIGHQSFPYWATWYQNQTEEFVIVGDGVLLRYNGEGGDVVIPDGVKYISASFDPDSEGRGYGTDFAPSITSITIPDSVTGIASKAFHRTEITELTLPDSVTEIGYQAFWQCWKLRKITIGDSVRNIDPYAFLSCDALEEINLPQGSYAEQYFESGVNSQVPRNYT